MEVSPQTSPLISPNFVANLPKLRPQSDQTSAVSPYFVVALCHKCLPKLRRSRGARSQERACSPLVDRLVVRNHPKPRSMSLDVYETVSLNFRLKAAVSTSGVSPNFAEWVSGRVTAIGTEQEVYTVTRSRAYAYEGNVRSRTAGVFG